MFHRLAWYSDMPSSVHPVAKPAKYWICQILNWNLSENYPVNVVSNTWKHIGTHVEGFPVKPSTQPCPGHSYDRKEPKGRTSEVHILGCSLPIHSQVVQKNSRGVRKVSDAIANQFLKGGKGQTDLITAYQQAGGNIDPCRFFSMR